MIAIDDPGKSSLKPSIGDDSLDYLNIMNILQAKRAVILVIFKFQITKEVEIHNNIQKIIS